jgi:hypothetical protein
MPEGTSLPPVLAAALEREVAATLGIVAARLRRGAPPFAARPLIPVAFRFTIVAAADARGAEREISVTLGPAGLETVERAASPATGGAAGGR